ncbi:MAG: hypothetical protein STSR0004_01410 [Peptococcaceae bacterium]
MLLFGHLGITLAATQAFEKVMFFQGKKRFSDLIDYRLVLLGSILPATYGPDQRTRELALK